MPRRRAATTSAFSPPFIRSHGIPHRSLVALGLVAACFCFFTLDQVITMLVITRILLQFFLQHVGVMLLRVQRPELERPFRIPLYPLPPLAAMAGFHIHPGQPHPRDRGTGCGGGHCRLRNRHLPGPRAGGWGSGRLRRAANGVHPIRPVEPLQ